MPRSGKREELMQAWKARIRPSPAARPPATHLGYSATRQWTAAAPPPAADPAPTLAGSGSRQQQAMLKGLPHREQALLVHALPSEDQPGVLVRMPPDQAAPVLAAMPRPAQLLSRLPAGTAAAVIPRLPPDTRAGLLAEMSAQAKAAAFGAMPARVKMKLLPSLSPADKTMVTADVTSPPRNNPARTPPRESPGEVERLRAELAKAGTPPLAEPPRQTSPAPSPDDEKRRREQRQHALEARNATLQSDLIRARDEAAAARAKLEQAAVSVAELAGLRERASRADAAQAEAAELRGRLVAAHAENERLRGRAGQLAAELDESCQRVSRSEAELLASQAAAEPDWRREQGLRTVKWAVSRAAGDRIRAALASWKRNCDVRELPAPDELAVAKQELLLVARSKDQLQKAAESRVEAVRTSLGQSQARVATLEAELGRLRESFGPGAAGELKELVREKGVLQGKLEALEQSSSAQLADLNQRLEASNVDNKMLEQQLQDPLACQVVAGLESKVAELRLRLRQELEKQMLQTRQEAGAVGRLEGKVSELQQLVVEKTDAIGALQGKLDLMKQMHDKLLDESCAYPRTPQRAVTPSRGDLELKIAQLERTLLARDSVLEAAHGDLAASAARQELMRAELAQALTRTAEQLEASLGESPVGRGLAPESLVVAGGVEASAAEVKRRLSGKLDAMPQMQARLDAQRSAAAEGSPGVISGLQGLLGRRLDGLRVGDDGLGMSRMLEDAELVAQVVNSLSVLLDVLEEKSEASTMLQGRLDTIRAMRAESEEEEQTRWLEDKVAELKALLRARVHEAGVLHGKLEAMRRKQAGDTDSEVVAGLEGQLAELLEVKVTELQSQLMDKLDGTYQDPELSTSKAEVAELRMLLKDKEMAMGAMQSRLDSYEEHHRSMRGVEVATLEATISELRGRLAERNDPGQLALPGRLEASEVASIEGTVGEVLAIVRGLQSTQ